MLNNITVQSTILHEVISQYRVLYFMKSYHTTSCYAKMIENVCMIWNIEDVAV